MRTLQQRGLIEEISRDPGPGQAVLFGTSAMFLERLGLDSVDDLPPLGQFVPGADVFEALERGLRPETPDEMAASAAAATEAGASPDSDVDDLGQARYAPGMQGDLDDADDLDPADVDEVEVEEIDAERGSAPEEPHRADDDRD
jgi:segregation and condensation protein B